MVKHLILGLVLGMTKILYCPVCIKSVTFARHGGERLGMF
jgi:hypothetical protein